MSRLRFRLTAALLRNPLGALLGLLAVVAALVAVLVPLFSARYPAITDLPEHAASSAAFRHYLDPSFHFREQFTLRPLAVPYMSLYAMTAALMFVFPVLTSIKLAAAVMLLLVPAGLAVLVHGMKKSPLLGLLGLGVTWCNLTHWGFLNHMGALGLFAMAVGLTMLVLDRPTRGRQLGLALTLVALHFTHIFRQPFALAAVVGTTIVLYPATRRVKPVLAPLLPALGLFAHWLIVRPNPVRVPLGELKADFNRVREIFPLFCSNFHDPTEREAFTMFLWVAGCTAVVSLVGLLVEDRLPRTRKGWAFAGGAALVPVCCAAVFLACFFLLPLWLGTWWFVYPREAVTAAFVLLALAPDLPRAPALRALLTAGLVAAGLRISTLVSSHYAKLDAVTSDFTQITALLPKAPKNMVFIGFTDITGVPGDNRWIADRRAQAVRDALEAKGIDPAKSSIEVKAATSPRDDNATEAGRERNRRVSIRITY